MMCRMKQSLQREVVQQLLVLRYVPLDTAVGHASSGVGRWMDGATRRPGGIPDREDTPSNTADRQQKHSPLTAANSRLCQVMISKLVECSFHGFNIEFVSNLCGLD